LGHRPEILCSSEEAPVARALLGAMGSAVLLTEPVMRIAALPAPALMARLHKH